MPSWIPEQQSKSSADQKVGPRRRQDRRLQAGRKLMFGSVVLAVLMLFASFQNFTEIVNEKSLIVVPEPQTSQRPIDAEEKPIDESANSAPLKSAKQSGLAPFDHFPAKGWRSTSEKSRQLATPSLNSITHPQDPAIDE